MSKSVVITGAAGFLGSRMADWVLDNCPGIEVIGIDDLSGGYIDNIDKRVNFHQLDCSGPGLRKVFEKHRPSHVFHFAAYAAEGLSPFIRKYNYQNNLVATANVINECIRAGVSRLVFTSSMAVYGHGSPPFDESFQPLPIDPYGIAKYACEMDIQVAGEQHGLDWCIIRPHNLYGIKQNIWDPYRNVLGIWMYQLLNGQPLTVYGAGGQTRAFSFIDDCLPCLWNAAMREKASEQIINLGSGIEYQIRHAAEMLIDIAGSGEIVYLAQRHEVKDAVPAWEKSVEFLDFVDQTDLRTGLSTMWEWAKKQPQRERFVWPQYELDNGLYDFWKSVDKK